MPFNGSGTYSLSDTIANGTPNDADELQAILDDIATGLTNAVCVDGQSSMTGVLKLANGSAAAPSATFASDTNTGFYRKAADQTGVAANGSEVGYFSSAGFVGNVTGNVTGTLTGGWAYMPSGTKALFQQTAAPTGWTKDTTHNNKALRVVSGNVVNGGTVDFTTAFASKSVSGTVGDTTLTTDQIPAHTHTVTGQQLASAAVGNFCLTVGGTSFTTSSTGGGNSHTHTFTGTAIDLAVAYVDVIVATKDA